MAAPTTPKLEIEWVPGSNSFSDITTDIDMSVGIAIRFGRTDPNDTAESASFSCQLVNKTGKYFQAALLKDGVTANPNYPNVVPHLRVRFSWVVSAVTKYRFTGYGHGFTPLVENGIRPYVVLTANCRMNDLAKKELRGWLVEEIAQQPVDLLAYYPMSDPAPSSGLGSAFFTDQSGNNKPNLVQANIGQTGVTALMASASDPFPQSEGATGAAFTQDTSNALNTGYQTVNLSMNMTGTFVGFWVTMPPSVTGATSEAQLLLGSSASGVNAFSLVVADVGDGNGPMMSVGQVGSGGSVSYNAVGSMTAGAPHFIGFEVNGSGGSYNFTTTIDGGNENDFSTSTVIPLTQLQLQYLQSTSPAATGDIVVGGLMVFVDPTITTSQPDVNRLHNAGTGFAGDLTGTRIQKLLTYAGLTSSDWSVDPGAETLSGEQTIAGRYVLDCCQEVSVTEGGGSVFYTSPAGSMRFVDRNSRAQYLSGNASAFFDAVKDLDGTQYAPSYGDDQPILVNSSTVTRPGGLTQTWTDPNSHAQATDQVTSYALSDGAALALAQYRVAALGYPQFRFGQLALAALTATSTTYGYIAGLEPGSDIEIFALTPAVNAPTTEVHVYVEGWSETYVLGDNPTYDWVADTSPAPAFWQGIFDDADLGRYEPDDGTWTLTSTITSSVTALSLTTSAGLVLTNTAGDLPLKISIGDEVINVTAVSGASSPQTLTVTRAQQASRAAPHTAGAAISLWPNPKWAL